MKEGPAGRLGSVITLAFSARLARIEGRGVRRYFVFS
jgi:hypothetical protein